MLLVALSLLSASGCMLVFPVPDSGAGCQGESAGWYPAPEVVRSKATADLGCPLAETGIEQVGETTYRATGCGAYEDYVCESEEVPGCSLEEAAERESCARAE